MEQDPEPVLSTSHPYNPIQQDPPSASKHGHYSGGFTTQNKCLCSPCPPPLDARPTTHALYISLH